MLSVACFIAASVAQRAVPQADASLTNQWHQALNTARHGDVHQALILTNHLLAEHPDFVPALKLQAMLLEDSGRSAEAGLFYERGLKLAPSDTDLLFKVGVYRLVAGDKDEAIQLLLHHLKLDPKDGDGLYYLAQAYHLTGRDDMAIKTIQDCLKYDADNPSVWQKYGELLCSSGGLRDGFRMASKSPAVQPES